MAWMGSFMDCWLRMQAHTPLQGEATLAIIKRSGASHYELHYKDDLKSWSEKHLERKFRVVVCPSSHEMRILLKSSQFNLFEGKDDASPETAPQTG